MLSTIEVDLAIGNNVLLGSNTTATDVSGLNTLVGQHEFSIYGYDANTGELLIRNPWGAPGNAQAQPTFEVSLSTLPTRSATPSPSTKFGPSSNAGASVAQVASLQANAPASSITVLDTAVDIVAGMSALLSGASKLSSIVVSNNAPLTLTVAQVTADAAVLAKRPAPTARPTRSTSRTMRRICSEISLQSRAIRMSRT